MKDIKIADFGCLVLALLIAGALLSVAVDRAADSLDNIANAVAAQHTK